MRKAVYPLPLVVAVSICLFLGACGGSNNEKPSDPLTEPAKNSEVATQTISFAGINFPIPAYYDFKDPKSTEINVYYYPQNEDYSSSILLTAYESRVTPAEFKAGKQALVDDFMENVGNNASETSIEDITVAGLSGLHVSFSVQEENVLATGHLVLINNIYESNLIMILQMHDSKDQSDHDYDGDFNKILESATLIQSSSSESSSESILTKPQQPVESTRPSTSEMIGSGDLGDFYVEIKGGQLAEDYEGKPVCIITYSWTNNSDETTSAIYEIGAKAFQDGVELDTAYFILDKSVYDTGTSMKDVRPGATADVQCAFILANETSDVEFELSEFFTFSKDAPKVIKKFIIN